MKKPIVVILLAACAAALLVVVGRSWSAIGGHDDRPFVDRDTWPEDV